MLRTGDVCLLDEDVWISLLPVSEERCELRLSAFREDEHDSPEGFPCVRLWFPREVLRHRLHLVELAYLYRDTLKDLEHASFSVHDHRLKGPSTLLEYLPSLVVRCHDLPRHISPPHVPLKAWRTKDTDTPRVSKERGVCDEDRGFWGERLLHYLDRFKASTHPLHPSIHSCAQLFQILFSPDVFTPEFCILSGRLFR